MKIMVVSLFERIRQPPRRFAVPALLQRVARQPTVAW
jgi:hypothetical protein